jgi:hypothetical protein
VFFALSSREAERAAMVPSVKSKRKKAAFSADFPLLRKRTVYNARRFTVE